MPIRNRRLPGLLHTRKLKALGYNRATGLGGRVRCDRRTNSASRLEGREGSVTSESIEKGYSEGADWPPRSPIDVLENRDADDVTFLANLAISALPKILGVDLLGFRG
jgi:hypothetical protein